MQAATWRTLSSGLAWLDEPRTLPPLLPKEGPRVGEIIGHRLWIYREEFDCLWSYAANTKWLPGEVMKDTTNNEMISIHDHNLAGSWGFKNPYLLMAEFKPWLSPNNYVIGTVYMWGTVIEHTKGYRAQYASIRSIDWSFDHDEDVLDRLRKMYKLKEDLKPNE